MRSDELERQIENQSRTIEELKEVNERLRSALGFYADPGNWSGKRTLNEYLREPDDPKSCYYFSNALRAYLGHGCVVAREALHDMNFGFWRFHGHRKMEEAWNKAAKMYQAIAEENRELRKSLKLECRYCNRTQSDESSCVMCAPRASDSLR